MSTGFFGFHAKVTRPQRSTPTNAPTTTGDVANSSNAGNTPSALTVSELSSKISGAIRTGFPAPIWVRGEVTGYRGPQASGHHYFSLKDATNQINCVVWAGEARNIRFKWADGMEVLALGAVATYPARSNYQLKVSQLLPVGQGALELAFRQLKEKLEREGLFSPERKQPIPAFPRRVALVTSRGAAGLADMLKVLTRFRWLKLMLFHVPVQGGQAAPAIARALATLNAHAETLGGIDVVLLARGGGSLEDLWAFNEEAVARAVAASDIPVVTGIGHEVDVSIADLVADYHAHTPTEAARVVTHGWLDAVEMLQGARDRLGRLTTDLLTHSRERLGSVARHETFRRPVDTIVRSRQQRVDDLSHRLNAAMGRRLGFLRQRIARVDELLQTHRPTAVLASLRARLDGFADRLAARHPLHAVRRTADRIGAIEARLAVAMRQDLARRSALLEALTRQLDAVGPQQVLQRGYSITMRLADRAIIRNAADIKPGDRMVTRFAEGEYEWSAGDGQMVLFGEEARSDGATKRRRKK